MPLQQIARSRHNMEEDDVEKSSPEQILPECHGIEGGDDLDILTGLELHIGQVFFLDTSPSLL